jgi:hypothetical protein
MKTMLVSSALLLAALAVSGCGGAGEKGADATTLGTSRKSGPQVPSGTRLTVQITTPVSSETAQAGDGWEGTTTGDIVVGDEVLVPSGTTVRGKVRNVLPAKKGDRAMLDLEVSSLEIGGEPVDVTAYSEPVIAGSPRARNLGAIAGGAAAGALIGKAVGGEGKDAATGAIIGGAAATAGVAASKGYQVVLQSGTVMEFDVQ